MSPPLTSELPVSIVKPLRDRTALEKHRVILECTVSSPRCTATWYKGKEEVVPSDRVEILADECSLKLVIQQVEVEDEGTYTIKVGEHTSKAKLMVEGKLGGEGPKEGTTNCGWLFDLFLMFCCSPGPRDGQTPRGRGGNRA